MFYLTHRGIARHQAALTSTVCLKTMSNENNMKSSQQKHLKRSRHTEHGVQPRKKHMTLLKQRVSAKFNLGNERRENLLSMASAALQRSKRAAFI